MIVRQTLPKMTDLFVYPMDVDKGGRPHACCRWTDEDGDHLVVSRDVRVSFEGLHLVITYWIESEGAE